MTTEDGSTNQNNDDNIKALRDKAGRVDELDAKVNELTRELAVRDSKVDRDHAAFELFQKGYDGEWTPDALNTAAEKYGLLKSQDGSKGGEQQQQSGMEFSDEQLTWLKDNVPGMAGLQQPDQNADAAAAMQRMQQAQQGGSATPPGNTSSDSWKNATDPATALAAYQAAGGVVTSGD